jgi:hypothetical protein
VRQIHPLTRGTMPRALNIGVETARVDDPKIDHPEVSP